MSKVDPTTLDYKHLEPGNAPRFGVTRSASTNIQDATFNTIAWFINLQDAQSFAYRYAYRVLDLEAGQFVF